ncbi:MAG: hypothetical protein KF865_12375 [Bdellovibrionaceae bacterium]|nr:hypothetical protein [Pseudobdellovibrionaceae bacterium]
MIRRFLPVIAALTLMTPPVPAETRSAEPPRPPQFVLLAFDGSLNLNFWQASRGFALRQRSRQRTVKFTYFLSGVYFLANANKKLYTAPTHAAGQSAIGFGGGAESLPLRVEQVNLAFLEGHEMGSHANGHYDAGVEKWTQQDWLSEFTQFNNLIFNTFRLNRVKPVRPQGWLLKPADVVGFRAPQLGVTQGLWPTLQRFRFRYDTSRVSAPTYWPEKTPYGLWNFPLAQLPIVGTAKRTLSMDYNFYVSQSAARPRPEMKEVFQDQMLQSYLKYFRDNYYGNRAPLHIGHHFSLWNGGAYWDAMQEFAQQVCGQPEVYCVTYKEYADWLDRQTPEALSDYRAGRFPPYRRPLPLAQASSRGLDADRIYDLSLRLESRMDGVRMNVRTSEPDQATYRREIVLNDRVFEGGQLSWTQLRQAAGPVESVLVQARLLNRHGVEIATATHEVKGLGHVHPALAPAPLEAQALQGDLPGAHDER